MKKKDTPKHITCYNGPAFKGFRVMITRKGHAFRLYTSAAKQASKSPIVRMVKAKESAINALASLALIISKPTYMRDGKLTQKATKAIEALGFSITETV